MPLAVLLIVLFSGFTPYLAAFWGITGCIVLGYQSQSVVAVASGGDRACIADPDRVAGLLDHRASIALGLAC